MTITIKSNPDGVTGAIQVNGVDKVTIGTSGITAGSFAPNSIDAAAAALAFSGANQSLATNGYQKLPGGLIKQWGRQSGATPSGSTVTFPFAFPNAVIGVTGVVLSNNATWCYVMSATALSLGSFVLHKNYVGASQFGIAGEDVHWEAIGY